MLAHGARVAAGACRACVPHLSELSDFCARGAPVGYATSAARGLCTTWPAQATGPDATVYSGPTTADRKRVTLRHIRKKYLEGGKLSMVTAYDYPSAKHVDDAGIDMLLVGDSAAMVVHGHDNTLPITLDEMLTHCKAAARGARAPFLIGDLPFGTYETGAPQAVGAAVRMLKEGSMDAVKLEGGSTARVDAARAIVAAGIACMGHVGLTPQSVSAIGGFRPQAQRSESALRTVQAAQALESAGCFALILECVPPPVAAAVTAAVRIPTIGIGAGPHCSGQVLVFHDLLGMMSHPHHAQVTPKFCKQYAHVGTHINHGLTAFRSDVEAGRYPDAATSPYKMGAAELSSFCELLESAGLEDSAEAALMPVQGPPTAPTA